ncbi:uncharacterized protein [Diadema antillarum]|uniref:uncharacterized protein n=1 Tax=Diadema antillarum TaxID=105358 RepID=UPI003A853B3B
MPTIGVCTSDMETNIQALLTRLRETSNADIKFVKLPYNDVGSYPLDSMNVDGIILCHSKHNRRFALTDVTDALYDGFLSNAKRVFGKDNVAVIGHDFKWPLGDGESVKETFMERFKREQPTTFQCSRLALICGRLDRIVHMDEDDLQLLQEFMASCHREQTGEAPVIICRMSTIIGVCSSARRDNVSGLLSRLNRIPNVGAEFVKLPYNDLDRFRLPRGRLHAIILCHSIHNRCFAITDVRDALYNKFLPYAKHTLGKQNVAVIGHDFSWPLSKEDVQSGISHSQKKRSQMTTFRNQQPTTFACSSLAMVCGRLDANWEMDPEDWESLVWFVTNVTTLKQTSFLQPWYLFAASLSFSASAW